MHLSSDPDRKDFAPLNSERFRFRVALAKRFAKLSEILRYSRLQAIAMTTSGNAQPTEVELQILRVIWDLGPSPVRDIHDRLEAEKGTNYSTTVKMLSVMLQKGLVTRKEGQRPHIYRATVSRRSAGKRMVRDLIDKVYQGSATSLVLQALSSRRPSAEEISEVRRLLDEMEDRS